MLVEHVGEDPVLVLEPTVTANGRLGRVCCRRESPSRDCCDERDGGGSGG
jgi:hypothetical protein